MLRLPKRSLFAAICLWISQTPIVAWNDAGHLLVAQIAYQRLTATEQQKLQGQLAGLSEGTHNYNAISAACFADDLRNDKHLFASSHYIAPPFTLSGKPLPTRSNVVAGLNHCVAVAKGTTSDPHLDRQQALAMSMHFVGDIHQPLHCTSHRLNGHDDANGNAIALTNLRDASHPNLHAFWDSAFQRWWTKGAVRSSFALARPTSVTDTPVATRAAFLVAHYPPPSNWNAGGFDPARWAAQSHRVGYLVGYKHLPGGENRSSATLDAGYVAAANTATCRQLVVAGYRIAALQKNLLATMPPPSARRRAIHRR